MVNEGIATQPAVTGLGQDFERLWRGFAVSTLGTYLALDAFSLVAILVLDVGPLQVSLLAAAGGAVGAVLAVPLGAWIEFRPKRRLMVRADLLRFLVLLTVPVAYFAGALSYPQLLIAAMVVAVADIVFLGASSAHLKGLVAQDDLLAANSRFETATWISASAGPPLGGVLIGALGPVVTVLLNAASFLLSALCIRSIEIPEPAPPVRPAATSRLVELTEGWRTIAANPVLRLLLCNVALVNPLIMATSPLLAYLMLSDLGFAPWQYGLGFGVACLGGILGARLARPLVRRYGQRRILLVFGAARVPWLLGLPFVQAGAPGLLLVMAVEFGMITCMGIFNPSLATFRLLHTQNDKVARVLTAWTITTRLVTAAAVVGWGVLAGQTGTRTALAIGAVLMLATPAVLPWRRTRE
ncbi:MFS transporter [Nocardia sp. NPDC050175]|uniref:MFS transporter n=1 Tax=Nocardia sp. NPDC050175 TaxID=3364317 RepID=UPI0037956142